MDAVTGGSINPLVDSSGTTANNCALYSATQNNSTTSGDLTLNNCYVQERIVCRANNTLTILNSISQAADWYLGQPADSGAVSLVNFCRILENANANEFGAGSSDNIVNIDSSAEFVNLAGGDYRIKSTSTYATDGQAGGLIGPFLEASSGISLTVDSGTYSQTGTNTPLFSSRILQTDTSSYSQAGTTTPLRAELNITTTSGSYLLTGSDVNLKAARKLITETGSYNLTGTDVTLIYTPGGGGEILVIDSGVYSLTGDELLLSAQLNIIGNSGNYLLSGTETRIAYNANIVTDTASYSLTGSNINLFANYGMIVLSTSYTLTGTSVTLKYSGDTNQIIGTVAAGFAPDLYSVGYKPNTITVTFKE